MAPPKSNIHRKDCLAIAGIFLLALVLRLPASWDLHLAGDPANYVKLAWSMRYTNSLDVPAGTMYSFGYSIFIFLASYLIPNLDQAAVAVSIFFGALSPVLLFFMGRMLFGFNVGLIAGLGLALFMPHIHVSNSPLSESTYIFWSLVSTYVHIKGILKPRPLYWYAIAGALFGFTFIIRPEIQITFTFMSAFGLYLLYKKGRVGSLRLVVIALILGLSFLAVNTPRIIWLHKVTGNWMMDVRKNGTIGGADRLQKDLARNADYDEINTGVEESNYGLSARGELNQLEKHSFGKWLLEDPGMRFSYYWRNVLTSVKNLTAPVLLVLAFVFFSFYLGKKENYKNKLLMVTLFAPVIVIPFFYSLGGGSWYGRAEPVVAYAPALVLLAADGFILCFNWLLQSGGMWRAAATYVFASSVALFWAYSAASLPVQLVKNWGTPVPDSINNMRIKIDQNIGEWIDRTLPKDARIMTSSWTISRYSNREREMLPYAGFQDVMAYAKKKRVEYIIIGNAFGWNRPQLEFLVPPKNKDYKNVYVNYLDLVDESDEQQENGFTYNFPVAIYMIK